MSHFSDRLSRGEREHGDKWDPRDLVAAPVSIRAAYETGERVKVRTRYGEEITGRVSTTTGSRPCFLLVRRSNALGSSDLLGADDQVIARQVGRRYVPC